MLKITRTVSAMIRPVRNADRDIGSDRSRSSRPLLASSFTPRAVPKALKATICTTIPGTRKFT
jgi:hypothetical protein